MGANKIANELLNINNLMSIILYKTY